jgi:hypothetical protein
VYFIFCEATVAVGSGDGFEAAPGELGFAAAVLADADAAALAAAETDGAAETELDAEIEGLALFPRFPLATAPIIPISTRRATTAPQPTPSFFAMIILPRKAADMSWDRRR